MPTVIISAPVSNKPSRISGEAGQRLYWTIKANYPDVDVRWLPNEKSTRENAPVIKKLVENGDALFVYYGHGYPSKLCGRIPPLCTKDAEGFIDTENTDVLRDSVTYAVSCWTAKRLGRSAEAAGAQCYVGFRKPVYVAFPLKEHNYRADIIDVWNTFPLRMIEGATVANAMTAMRDKSLGYEEMYERAGNALLHGDYYARRFSSNREAICAFGDIGATIFGLH
ncbi:MAG: hypothetical protein J7K40_05985 [candidate division Zixibacteria bacterium]|nr:hypothetical protein [candidate division Zixibacteria bacterium]